MRLLRVATVLGAFAAGCIGGLTGPAISVPGETLAGSELQVDTWNLIVMFLLREAPPCAGFFMPGAGCQGMAGGAFLTVD